MYVWPRTHSSDRSSRDLDRFHERPGQEPSARHAGNLDVCGQQLRGLKMSVRRTVAALRQVIGLHAGQQLSSSLSADVLDLKTDFLTHLDEVANLGRSLWCRRNVQRTGADEESLFEPALEVEHDVEPRIEQTGLIGTRA